jgi:hypothetical protein
MPETKTAVRQLCRRVLALSWISTAWLICLAPPSALGTEVPVGMLDLTDAVVVTPAELSGTERKAVTMLVEEVQKRAAVHWTVVNAWPMGSAPVIAVGPASLRVAFDGRLAQKLDDGGPSHRAEGYQIRIDPDERSVIVAGNDARGVLFGVGRLLRELRLSRGRVLVPDRFGLATAPRYPLRGHQLGYRPKTNSYDGWDLAQWERYIRDLAVFGANAVELIPPRSDDAADSPHYPLPPIEMMTGMSKLLDDYGLDVWIWYPAMDEDYSNPKTVEFALEEWGGVFEKLPRIDAIFVPGGDPGHTQPKVLFAFLEKVT